jgi:hypothetical protein
VSKREVIIVGNVEYIYEKDLYKGRLQVQSRVPVMVEVKSKDNAGGEAWDWAQGHWPEFLDEAGPVIVIDGVEVPTTLRWCCVTGVEDKKGNQLPIAEPVRKKKKTKKATPHGGVAFKEKSKRVDKPKRAAPREKSALEEMAEKADIQKVKDRKMAEALAEEE